MIKNTDLINKVWLQISSANTLYHDQWVSDETYFRAISMQYPALTGAVTFSRTALNRALGTLAEELNPSNTSGIFLNRHSRQHAHVLWTRFVTYVIITTKYMASGDHSHGCKRRFGELTAVILRQPESSQES